MIHSKEDLKLYLDADSQNFKWITKAPFYSKLRNKFLCNPISDQWAIWNYIYTLRHAEYHLNNTGIIHKLCKLYWLFRLRKCSYKTGFQIPPNTCGKCLTIWHWGPIIVNPAAKIGDFCTLYSGVLIGHKIPGQPAPKIGSKVFIASGAKIIGGVEIGDNTIIGQNVVVSKDIPPGSKYVVPKGIYII